MREKKKRAMADRRRDLLKQMVEKKERKMKERVREADFALRAAGDSVKTGMYVAYEVADDVLKSILSPNRRGAGRSDEGADAGIQMDKSSVTADMVFELMDFIEDRCGSDMAQRMCDGVIRGRAQDGKLVLNQGSLKPLVNFALRAGGQDAAPNDTTLKQLFQPLRSIPKAYFCS